MSTLVKVRKTHLSQPRAVLIILRSMFKDEEDDDLVRLCESGIKTLTDMIGDKFDPLKYDSEK